MGLDHLRWLLPLWLVMGCAPATATREPTPPWVAEDDAQAPNDARGDDVGHDRGPHAVSVAESSADDPSTRWDTHTIAASEPPPARPPRVGQRDIRLYNARLDNALRMLATAGRFNLVVKGELAAPVSVDLHRVEPYDALLAIAEAHGIEVFYRDDIVIIGGE